MTTTTRTAYETRPYTPADEPQVLELLRASLGESGVLQRTPAMWRWKHMENAFGPSIGRVATDSEGRVVGLRAFLRWHFITGGHTVSAVRPVDTATHPAHQRRGIFERLTKEALTDARDEGVALIYNTPNARSMPGYLKLGWQVVGGVRPLVRVLNYRRFALGMTRHRLGRTTVAPFPAETFFKGNALPGVRILLENPHTDGLLAEDAALWGERLHTARSMDYLTWRYAQHPTIHYQAIGVSESGSLAACAVVRTNTRMGLREVVVSELALRRPDEALVKKLMDGLASRLDADYLIAYFPEGSFKRQALRESGFRQVPMEGMTLVAHPIGGPLGALASLPNWGVALGDLEFF